MAIKYDFFMGLPETSNIGSNASWILSEVECHMSISYSIEVKQSYMGKLFYKFHDILCCDS